MDRSTTSFIGDQIGMLTVDHSSNDCTAALRRVVVKDEAGKCTTFMRNNFALKPEHIASLHRQRSSVELFVKWSKQNLRIKAILGPAKT